MAKDECNARVHGEARTSQWDTLFHARWHAGIVIVLLLVGRAGADDDVSELTGGAKAVTTAPAGVVGPEVRGGEKRPAGAREGVVVLNDGKKLEGLVWTTFDTPLRFWVEAEKRYVDVEWGVIKRMEVKVVAEGMEDDWRWLKEGADQKVYSGKKYPNVELAYKVTLVNGEVIEGGVVAPVCVRDNTGGTISMAFYKKHKGAVGETMKDVVYVKSVELTGEAEGAVGMTRRLPLLPD